MSNKKSRRNQRQSESGSTKSGSTKSAPADPAATHSKSKPVGGSLPNRPPSTGLLRVDDSSSDDADTDLDEADFGDVEADTISDNVDIDHDETDDDDTYDDDTDDDEIDDDDTGETDAVDQVAAAGDSTDPAKSAKQTEKSADATSSIGTVTQPKSEVKQRSARRDPVTAARRTNRTSSRTAVVADAVEKTYGDLPALAPLDLTVSTGERVALIGHNGSGKTTFIKMLCGLLEPTGGTIEVFGHEPGSMPSRRAVSYLSDQPVFYEDLSLIEHIEYVARLHDVDDWTGLGEELLDRFRLSDRRDDLPVTFSRGLKQKASICLAFVRPFDLLVVDEPFVGLDALGRTELLALMADHHAAGATLIVATHELNTVAASDRIVALRSGEVAYDDAVDANRELDLDSLVDGAG